MRSARTFYPVQLFCHTVKVLFLKDMNLILHCGENILDRFDVRVTEGALELILVVAEVHRCPHERIPQSLQ